MLCYKIKFILYGILVDGNELILNYKKDKKRVAVEFSTATLLIWLRGLDSNQRPLGYEPNELPDCSTPRYT